jgi:hypothetical protein
MEESIEDLFRNLPDEIVGCIVSFYQMNMHLKPASYLLGGETCGTKFLLSMEL